MKKDTNKEITLLEPLTPKAIEVLRDEMMFYRDTAEEILNKIIDGLENLNKLDKPRADLLALMYRERAKCSDKLIECASKLAPYESPRLESIEQKIVEKKVFVIRSPNVIENKEEWLKNALLENKLLQDMREKVDAPFNEDRKE